MFLTAKLETIDCFLRWQVPTEIAVAGPNLPESDLQLGHLVCQVWSQDSCNGMKAKVTRTVPE